MADVVSQALIHGGSAQGSADSSDDTYSEVSNSTFRADLRPSTFSTQSSLSGIPTSGPDTLKPWARQKSFRQSSFGNDENSYWAPDGTATSGRMSAPAMDRGQYQRQDQRTLLLKGLSDRATHKDITNVVRGGAVLDLYLRAYDRTANVSFVEGSAAQAFMAHARRKDIYMHGKRVGRHKGSPNER